MDSQEVANALKGMLGEMESIYVPEFLAAGNLGDFSEILKKLISLQRSLFGFLAEEVWWGSPGGADAQAHLRELARDRSSNLIMALTAVRTILQGGPYLARPSFAVMIADNITRLETCLLKVQGELIYAIKALGEKK